MSKNTLMSFKNATLAFVVMMAAASMTGCKDHKEHNETETCTDQDVRELYEKLKDQDPRYYIKEDKITQTAPKTVKSKDSLSR